MKIKAHPSQATLREYFTLEADGRLIWKIKRGRASAGAVAGCLNSRGRWRVSIDGEYFLRSRLVWIFVHGEIPKNMEIDHIDRVGTNDRVSNLRLATRRNNQCNMAPRGRGKFKGVFPANARQGWVAQITVSGKTYHLGTFPSEIEAAFAYDSAARRSHGAFAFTNSAVA